MMPREVSQPDWGEWVLGDLADTLRDVADMLGQATEVAHVEVDPPSEDLPFPQIKVTLLSELQVMRLRSCLLAGEFLVDWIGCSDSQRWCANVAGVRLTAELAGEPS